MSKLWSINACQTNMNLQHGQMIFKTRIHKEDNAVAYCFVFEILSLLGNPPTRHPSPSGQPSTGRMKQSEVVAVTNTGDSAQ